MYDIVNKTREINRLYNIVEDGEKYTDEELRTTMLKMYYDNYANAKCRCIMDEEDFWELVNMDEHKLHSIYNNNTNITNLSRLDMVLIAVGSIDSIELLGESVDEHKMDIIASDNIIDNSMLLRVLIRSFNAHNRSNIRYTSLNENIFSNDIMKLIVFNIRDMNTLISFYCTSSYYRNIISSDQFIKHFYNVISNTKSDIDRYCKYINTVPCKFGGKSNSLESLLRYYYRLFYNKKCYFMYDPNYYLWCCIYYNNIEEYFKYAPINIIDTNNVKLMCELNREDMLDFSLDILQRANMSYHIHDNVLNYRRRIYDTIMDCASDSLIKSVIHKINYVTSKILCKALEYNLDKYVIFNMLNSLTDCDNFHMIIDKLVTIHNTGNNSPVTKVIIKKTLERILGYIEEILYEGHNGNIENTFLLVANYCSYYTVIELVARDYWSVKDLTLFILRILTIDDKGKMYVIICGLYDCKLHNIFVDDNVSSIICEGILYIEVLSIVKQINMKYTDNHEWLLSLDDNELTSFLGSLINFNNESSTQLISRIRNIYESYSDIHCVNVIDNFISSTTISNISAISISEII